MMSLDILIVSPLIDIPTTISSEAALRLAEWCKTQGAKVQTLFGWTPNMIGFWLSLFGNPKIISYWGHGAETELFGSDIFFGMVTLGNADWLNGRITHAMACLSAKQLGDEVIKRGGVCYYGSTEEMIAAFPEAEHNYLEDWVDAQTAIPKYLITILLKNGSITTTDLQEAYSRYLAKSQEYIAAYKQGYSDGTLPNGDWYAESFSQNSQYYKLILP